MTPKQQRFCDAYLSNGGNATQAAIFAGYSKKTAAQQGSRLLRLSSVSSYLNKNGGNASGSAALSHVDILAELQRVVMTPLTGGVRAAHKLKALQMLEKVQPTSERKGDFDIVDALNIGAFFSWRDDSMTDAEIAAKVREIWAAYDIEE